MSSTQAAMGPSACFYLETDGETLSLEFWDGHNEPDPNLYPRNIRTIAWQAPPNEVYGPTAEQARSDFIWLASSLATFHKVHLIRNDGMTEPEDEPNPSDSDNHLITSSEHYRDPVTDPEVEVLEEF